MNYLDRIISSPQLITLLIVIFAFLFVVISLSLLLVIYRKTETVKNLLWFPKEIMKLYSDQPSFFSKKRVESGIAFMGSFIITVVYCIINIRIITPIGLTVIIGPWLLIAGYNIGKTQDEKLQG